MREDGRKARTTQLRALWFISEFREMHTFSPTVREIGKALGFASPSGGMETVRGLRAAGWIRSVPGVPRTITLTQEGRDLLKREGVSCL